MIRFVKKYAFVYRLGTRESQRGQEKVDAEGSAFAKEISDSCSILCVMEHNQNFHCKTVLNLI